MSVVEKPIRVAVYGDSLFIRGITSSLKGAPGLEVVQFHGETPDACLSGAIPSASLLAFDVRETSLDLMLALLKETPQLILLALDPESDRLLVLSSQASGAQKIGDLVEVIRRHQAVE